MDDPIDLRVSTVGRVHPNNEVLLRIILRMRRKKIINKIDIFLKVNELDKIVVIHKKSYCELLVSVKKTLKYL